MSDKIRWGIIGTGNIARRFAEGLAVLPDAELVAVGSRSQTTADEFGGAFNIPHRHASYAALADDPAVDVVYISTPQNRHHEDTLLCLNAGKAALCEKPFTINAKQAEEVIRLARRKRLFLMEAMWTRALPAIQRVRQLLAEGAIGEVRLIIADFGIRPQFDPQHRLFKLELGGGALLDLGVYPVTLAAMMFGPPQTITSQVQIGSTGVDEHNAIILSTAQGQLAMLTSSLQVETPQEAHLIGTRGRIRIHAQWWHATAFSLWRADGPEEVISLPLEGNGYNYEAAEVMQCLRAGKSESDLIPLDETLSIMRTMDQIRGQWGLRYPTE